MDQKQLPESVRRQLPALLESHFVDRAENILAERYERRSLMITSNLVFSQWDRIFKDAMTTAAAIDRLVHHSTILELTNESFRMKEAESKLNKN